MTELARQVGISTPVMDSVINIVSVLMNRNYRGEKKRTMKTLGLDKYSLDELNEIL